MICNPKCDLFWRMFCVHLRRNCILLLWDRLSYKYQLNLSNLSVKACVSFLIFCLDDLSIDIWTLHYGHYNMWDIIVPTIIVLLLISLSMAVSICFVLRSFSVGWMNNCDCYILFLDWFLDHYVLSFLISCNLLYFKVFCLIWGLLLQLSFASHFMECTFPSSHFQSICVFMSEVGF